jgi:small subunit ribosomal protein S4e
MDMSILKIYLSFLPAEKMARGPKKHMKRLNAPKHWMLDKLGGVWAPRPSTGPHKLRECLPLCLILKNRLRYALTRREVVQICMRRCIEVDHKVRTDINYPAGFMDVITIKKTDEKYRLLYDVKGRFTVHKISAEECNFKLLKIKNKTTCNKASIGRNTASALSVAIPVAVTHDGRTVKYVDPDSSIGDTIKFDLTTNKALDLVKFEAGNVCMVTGGANKGRVGVLVSREKHPGSFEIAHLKDRRGNNFVTRAGNVFVIGEGAKPWVSLPRAKGIKLDIIEERDAAAAKSKKKD